MKFPNKFKFVISITNKNLLLIQSTPNIYDFGIINHEDVILDNFLDKTSYNNLPKESGIYSIDAKLTWNNVAAHDTPEYWECVFIFENIKKIYSL